MSQIWTTKDGRKIPVKEMTDVHLLNSLKYLKRTKKSNQEKLQQLDEEDYYFPEWDDDVSFEERAMMAGLSMRREKMIDANKEWIKILRKEVKKRGLKELDD